MAFEDIAVGAATEAPAAKIEEGEVVIDDENALYDANLAASDSIFVDYMITNHYEKDHHKYMMPLTSPQKFQGKSVAVVQLAAPTLLMICNWSALSYGRQPKSPKNDIGADWILLDEFCEPVMTNLAADGTTAIYRLNGTYVYANVNPSENLNTDCAFPRPPWLEDVIDRKVPDDIFMAGLLTAGAATIAGAAAGAVIGDTEGSIVESIKD